MEVIEIIECGEIRVETMDLWFVACKANLRPFEGGERSHIVQTADMSKCSAWESRWNSERRCKTTDSLLSSTTSNAALEKQNEQYKFVSLGYLQK